MRLYSTKQIISIDLRDVDALINKTLVLQNIKNTMIT